MPKRKHASPEPLNLLIADPAARRCILAILNAVSKYPMCAPEFSESFFQLFSILITRQELESSFKRFGAGLIFRNALTSQSDDGDYFEQSIADREAACRVHQSLGTEFQPRVVDDGVIRALRRGSHAILQDAARMALARLASDEDDSVVDWIEHNVRLLARLFGFSQTECELAKLAIAFSAASAEGNICGYCLGEILAGVQNRGPCVLRLAEMTNLHPREIRSGARADGPLALSGIFSSICLQDTSLDSALALSELGEFFAEERIENETALRKRFLKPVVLRRNADLVHDHIAQQKSDISALLTGAVAEGARGVNVLLYGPPGTGKTELAKQMTLDIGVTCFEVGCTDSSYTGEASRNDRLLYLGLANRLISPKEKAVILLDEAEDIFSQLPDQSFGMRAQSGSKAWVNALLENMRIPTIWISNSVEMDPAYLRRFAYSAALDVPPLSVRRKIVGLHTHEFKLGQAEVDLLAQSRALSPAMLSSAARFVNLAKVPSERIVDALQRHVRASQQVMHLEGGNVTSVAKSETTFDPKFVNLGKNVSADALALSLKREGRGAVLFSGPPGSGKTQLASYLARELDRDLVYRTTSDLQSMWLGETEKNISRLFRDTDDKRELIFLDEAEGLLASRANSTHVWEVTQVNEFLRHIEQFQGIFIAATNHRGCLDAALMRRFAIRLDFKPLNLEQRVEMLFHVSGIRVLNDHQEYRALAKLDQLTAGHFANVSRRLNMIGMHADEQTWLQELADEMDPQTHGGSLGIGFT